MNPATVTEDPREQLDAETGAVMERYASALHRQGLAAAAKAAADEDVQECEGQLRLLARSKVTP